MRFGFDPKIEATTRRDMARRLYEALEACESLGFEVVEFSLTERMFELGLRTVFGGDLLDLMQSAKPSFHVRLFPPDEGKGEPGLSNPNAYPRSLELRRIIQAVEFFETNHPLQL